MLDAFWNWLAALPPANASFIGTLTGSSLGLVAILLGALFNAHLNRRRDEELRAADRVALASTLFAEFRGVLRTLVENGEQLAARSSDPAGGFLVPQPSMAVVPELLPKLGLLSTDAARKVLDAYTITEQYLDALIHIGGELQADMPEGRQVVYLEGKHAKTVVAINKARATVVKDAMDVLAPYIQ